MGISRITYVFSLHTDVKSNTAITSAAGTMNARAINPYNSVYCMRASRSSVLC